MTLTVGKKVWMIEFNSIKYEAIDFTNKRIEFKHSTMFNV